MKEWVSSRDERIRDGKDASHVEMDGQVVAVDEDFNDPISGASGPAPGQMGDPADDINCRCVMVALMTEDEAI